MQRLPADALKKAASRGWTLGFGLFNVLILLFLVGPILAIVPLSFNDNTFIVYPLKGFTLHWYQELFASDVWLNATKNSFIVAPSAACLATVLGVICAFGLHRGRFVGKGLITAVLLAPTVTPLVVVAVAMYFYFNLYGINGTYIGLIVAHAALGAPFVIVTVSATLRTFNWDLVRASKSLGASPLQTFFRVTLPVIYPGVLTGTVFAFAISFDEVIVTLFVAGPGQVTIPRQMFTGLRENISPVILALACILVVLTTCLLLALNLLKRKRPL